MNKTMNKYQLLPITDSNNKINFNEKYKLRKTKNSVIGSYLEKLMNKNLKTMEEKIDYIVKKIDLDRWQDVNYPIEHQNGFDGCPIEKTTINIIMDALEIILNDYQVVIEFNSRELFKEEPVLDKIINVLKTIENGTQSGI